MPDAFADLDDDLAEEAGVDAAAALAASATDGEVFSDAEVEAAAAALACCTTVLSVELELRGIRHDLANPSRSPQSPPALRPA